MTPRGRGRNTFIGRSNSPANQGGRGHNPNHSHNHSTYQRQTCHIFNVNIVRGMVTTLLNVERKNMVKQNKIKITKKILQNIMCLCMHKDC